MHEWNNLMWCDVMWCVSSWGASSCSPGSSQLDGSACPVASSAGAWTERSDPRLPGALFAHWWQRAERRTHAGLRRHGWSVHYYLFWWAWWCNVRYQTYDQMVVGSIPGLWSPLTYQLQSVLNAAAWLITGKQKFDHIASTVRDDFHWLPVRQRIQFKLCTLVSKCLHRTAPSYLTAKKKVVNLYSTSSQTRL